MFITEFRVGNLMEILLIGVTFGITGIITVQLNTMMAILTYIHVKLHGG
jgi:hypothetical protein